MLTGQVGVLAADELTRLSVDDVQLPIAEIVLRETRDFVDALSRLGGAGVAHNDIAAVIEMAAFGTEVERAPEADVTLQGLELNGNHLTLVADALAPQTFERRLVFSDADVGHAA
jgi:hypothetical protein